MKGKRLITLAFLLFVCLGMILFTFNIREAEAATFTVTRTFTSLTYDGYISRTSAYQQSEALIDSYSVANYSSLYTLQNLHPSATVAGSAVSQCFQTPSVPCKLTSVKFYLAKYGSPIGNAKARLYAMTGTYGTDGTPTGSALAYSSDFDVSTLTTSPQLITFTFSGANQYEMQPNTYYCISYVNPVSGTINSNNYVATGYDITSPTHSGNVAEHYYSTWYAFASYDLIFYLYAKPLEQYNDVRNAINGLEFDSDVISAGQAYMVGSFYWISRGVIAFDTSIIPSDAIIISATLSLYVTVDLSDDDFNVTIQNGQPLYPHLPVELADYYYALYSGDGGTRNSSTVAEDQYWNITLNSVGSSWIQKDSITKLLLRSSKDIDAIAPTDYEEVEFAASEWGEAYAPKLYVTYEAVGYRYIVHGPYYESGAVADCITNITLFSKTENPISFVLNGSSGTANTTILDVEQAGWYFRWNASSTATRTYYLSTVTFDEFYVYVADPTKTYHTYTIKFMDLAGALNTMPYVKIQRYINGMKSVEKAKVDVEKKLTTFLEEGTAYTLIIEDTTSSYTFGDLLFTSETSITLTLKGIEFPQDIILAYQYNRIYAYRHNNQSSISIVYQDTKQQLADVSIRILFENGSSVSVIYPYWQNDTYYFNYTYPSAIYNTTYIVKVMIYHSAYGNMAYNTILAQAWTAQPWNLPIGTIPGFNMADLIPIIIIFACFLAFSQINAPTGAFIGTAMAIILTWLGWISIPSGLLVAAVCFCILFGLAYARKRG